MMQVTTLVWLAVAGTALGAPAEEAAGSMKQLKSLPLFKGLPKLEGLHAEALKGRDRYRLLVTPENAKRLGLEKAPDAQLSELGTPFRDYLVRLDMLARYNATTDPGNLLTDTKIVHYPLVVRSQVRSLVSVVLVKGLWKLSSVGDADRAGQVFAAIQKSARALPRSEGDHFSVRIPALNLEFVGIRDAQRALLVIPLEDNAEWALKAGVAEPASKVFERLVPFAKTHDGLPR